MAQFNLVKLLDGAVVFQSAVIPKGAYDNATIYLIGEAVSYTDGNSYVALDTTQGNLPTDTDYWMLLAEKGEAGTAGADTFIELTDTPNDYTGQAGKIPTVNATEDGLAFTDAGSGDMNKAVYDPTGVNADAFDYGNLNNTPTIPDELSDLTDDATHRLVTDTEKSDWNAKQDALGFTPEDVSNKENTTINTSSTKYPTVNLLKTGIETRNPYHGVLARTVGATNPLPTHITTTTFTLGATANPITYYYQGTRVTVSADKTATLADGAGLYFIYFNGITGNIVASKDFPGISESSNIIIATVIWNGTDYGLVNDERHSYSRNKTWHVWAHNTIGVRYRSGITLTHNGGTGAGATFATTAGEIADEDIQFAVPVSSAFPTANTCRLFWQTGASAYTFDKTVSTVPFKIGANSRPVYIKASDYSVVEMTSAVNKYINFFVYTTSDLHTPIYIFAESVSDTVDGNNGYSNLANARAVPFPNLSTFGLSPELKPIYRLIVRADGVLQAIDTTLDDYRSVSSLPMSAGTSSTTASAVSFNPTGNISATSVQTAIEELDTEKAPALGADDNYVTDAEKIVIGNTSGTNSGDEPDASDTVKGIVELAIASEINTGTDATRAITPDALAGSNLGIRIVALKVLDDSTVLTTGDGKMIFMIPIELNGMNLVSVAIAVTTVSSSGLPTIQIRNVTDSVDMLSTKASIDATEFTSYTATNAPVIDTTKDDVATGDLLAIDCDVAGTGAKGLLCCLGFQLP